MASDLDAPGLALEVRGWREKVIDDGAPMEMVERYKSYFDLAADDLEALAALRDIGGSEVDAFLDTFYEHMLSFPENRRFFPDSDTVARARKGQRDYFLSLLCGVWDEDVLRAIRHVGAVHDRIGIEPWQFNGMVAFYGARMVQYFLRGLPGQTRADMERAIQAWVKLLLLDVAMVWSSYSQARDQSLKNRVRELEAVNRFASQRVDELLETRRSLEEQVRRLDALTELGRIDFDEHIPEEAARRVLEKILDVMSVEAGEVWVVDHEAGRVMMVTQYGLYPTEFREITTFRLGEGFPGLVAASGEAVVTRDLAHDARFLRGGVVGQAFQFMACVPLESGQTVAGVLCIASRQQQPWDQERSNFLQAMGKLLGRRTLGLLLYELRRRGTGRNS